MVSAVLSAVLPMFCLLSFCPRAVAQTADNSVSNNAAPVQTNALPEPDRAAEDFVLVSLCIADPTDWRDDAIGTIGHAFLRLRCPYYNLDYCFSYEGENVNDNLYRYLTGKTKMGMFAIDRKSVV